jgi:hypothetical protein
LCGAAQVSVSIESRVAEKYAAAAAAAVAKWKFLRAAIDRRFLFRMILDSKT